MPNSLSDSQIEKLAESLKGQTSGFIVDMCREAAMNCIRRSLDSVTINEFKLS
jgi:SpoVK/Ycf46/Vps4 family AAA+-type ATPase